MEDFRSFEIMLKLVDAGFGRRNMSYIMMRCSFRVMIEVAERLVQPKESKVITLLRKHER